LLIVTRLHTMRYSDSRGCERVLGVSGVFG
jgi:hypothetical protein